MKGFRRVASRAVGLTLSPIKDRPFSGQLNFVVRQTRQSDLNISSGNLTVNANGLDLKRIVRKKRVAARRRATRDVGEDRIVAKLNLAFVHAPLDLSNNNLRLLDVVFKPMKIDQGQVVLLPEGLHSTANRKYLSVQYGGGRPIGHDARRLCATEWNDDCARGESCHHDESRHHAT